MKENKLKVITIILLILLTTMVAVFGVYNKVQNRLENGVKDYDYAIDLKGARVVTLKLDDSTTKTIKDSEGNVIEDATEEDIEQNGYTTEEVPVNSEDKLNEENYNLVKTIIEGRLKKLYVNEYEVRVNRGNGQILVKLPENDKTDDIISNLTTVGKFEIIDTDTEEVLLTNDDIKTSGALRSSTSTGVSIYFSIEFNDEGKQKLEEISKTYVPVTEESSEEISEKEGTKEVTVQEEGTTEVTVDSKDASSETSNKEKTVTMKVDDTEIMSTSFDEPITDGKLYLSIGQTTTDVDSLNDYLEQARDMSSILSNKNMPLTYKQVGNIYIASAVNDSITNIVLIGITVISVLILVIFVVRFKLKGLLATCSYIGAISLLMLIIRYTNVMLSTEGIAGIFAISILNFIFVNKILTSLKNKKEDKKAEPKHLINMAIKDITIKIIPLFIMAIIFTFISWVPTSSFGMVMFWGLTIIVLYNLFITKSLLKDGKQK